MLLSIYKHAHNIMPLINDRSPIIENHQPITADHLPMPNPFPQCFIETPMLPWGNIRNLKSEISNPLFVSIRFFPRNESTPCQIRSPSAFWGYDSFLDPQCSVGTRCPIWEESAITNQKSQIQQLFLIVSFSRNN